MTMNFIKKSVNSKTTNGVFISSGMEIAVELAADTGFDWVIIDMEHGLADESKMLSMIRCLDGTETAPIIRIPTLREEYIKRALDYGASGIMCPMINTSTEAQELVKLTRYPPEGKRGLTASSRASNYGKNFKDYFANANSNLLCIIQIETKEALNNIDAIAAVNGADILFIGHSDLSLSLGCYNDFNNDLVGQAEKDVITAAKNNNKIAGMLLKKEMVASEYATRGFKFIALGSDVGCLRSGYMNLSSKKSKQNE